MKVLSLSSSALAVYTLALLSLQFSKELFSNAGTPRTDEMGRASVANKEACRRLCWYRALCTSYSYCSTCQGQTNCLLHSSFVDDDGDTQPQDPAWTEEHASSPSPAHVCAQRTCGPDQTCLPSAQGSPLCLPLPAHCDLTSAPSGVRLNTSGLGGALGRQGQRLQVECVPDYVLVPAGVDANVQCQVNSKWTRFKGECVQVNFTNPEIPLKASLPWGISEGWGLCVKGKYGKGSISKILLSTHSCDSFSENNCNIVFRLVTRLWKVPRYQYAGLFWRLGRISAIKYLHKGDLPLQAGDTFTYAIQLLPTTLRLSIRSRVNYSFDILTNGPDEVIDLSNVTHVLIIGSVSLKFVNTLENC